MADEEVAGAERESDPGPERPSQLATEEILGVLAGGEVELKGRVPWSSNATFLAAVQPPGSGSDESSPVLAIYKPARGERPLWDFPGGLWRREVAAYQLDAFLGWGIVPPTVARENGPLGPGSLQYCVDAFFEEHYFTLVSSPEHHHDLRRIAAFDLVVNNADRKAGHCLLDQEGRIWAIDNGLSFHVEPKLRTVIWDFAGERIDAALLDSLAPLAAGDVPVAVRDLLATDELAALAARAGRARRKGKYPAPTGEFPYPWPLI